MENKSRLSAFHFIALVSVFTVANSVIEMPLYRESLSELFIAAAGGIIISFFIYKPLKTAMSANSGILKGAVFAVVFIFSLIAAVAASREYTAFIYENLLTKESAFLIKLIFALCTACIAAGDKKAIYKFSSISFFFVTAIFAVMFLISVKNFDLRNLKTAFDFSHISVKHTFAYGYKLLVPSVFAVLFIALDMPHNLPKFAVPAGVSWGVIICIITVLDSVLSFSLPLSARLEYPYIDDISTVTIGNLFTRMDGFAYFAFFVCYLLKCAVLIRLSADALCLAGIKKKRYAVILLSAVLLL